jgi:hypothetical protein
MKCAFKLEPNPDYHKGQQCLYKPEPYICQEKAGCKGCQVFIEWLAEHHGGIIAN